MRRDCKCRALSRAVRAAQRELRAHVGPEGWKLYLLLEEQMNARHLVLVAAAARIASKNGARTKRNGAAAARASAQRGAADPSRLRVRDHARRR